MKPFLATVAAAYADRYEDLSEVCFLFPNKRSGTFFLKYLSEAVGDRTVLAPEVLGIDEFMEQVSGLQTASRVETLFRLYRVYRRLLGRPGVIADDDDLLDFDRFAPWGETVISDFNEVEKYMVDAAAIFRNVRDYRDIAANFLTDEQAEVLQRYFGYRPDVGDVESFWKRVGDPSDSVVKERFVELWRLLPDLYSGLVADLGADGLGLAGTLFRRAAERVGAEGAPSLGWRRVVAVGFNTLSTAEVHLFAELRDTADAAGEAWGEFVWDATGPVLGHDGREGANGHNPATVALKRNIRNFPAPSWMLPWLAESDTDSMPQSIVESGAPSNVAQVKVAALKVSEWKADAAEEMKDARTAVVIPDENLLLPLIHSLPADLECLNLTMGHSMRYTAVASFVYHLRRLQTRARRADGAAAYHHDDLRLFMSHPLMQVLAGADHANAVNNQVASRRLRLVPVAFVTSICPEAELMLRPLSRRTTPLETLAWLDDVLGLLYVALSEEEGDAKTFDTNIELMQVERYRQALGQLQLCVEQHGIMMHFSSVFRMVDRLVGGEKVTFEGEPLRGLQVMGLLETRALDFDRLVILSMNDKVMPRRARRRTFIPDALRRGYGLPVSTQDEEQYAYYFYRLISRASEVTLVYDARAGEGMRSGGKSRFLLQLEMLYARGLMQARDYSFQLELESPKPQPVAKTEAVLARLEAFKKTGPEGRNLSASALTNYCRCQLLFYYKNVVGIKDEEHHPDYIDALTQGQVVHHALEALYFPAEDQGHLLETPIRVSAEDITAILDAPERVSAAVRRAVNAEHFHLDGRYEGSVPDLDRALPESFALVAHRMERQVRRVLEYDRRLAPLYLLGGEMKRYTRYKVGDAPEVNMYAVFDRVDIVAGRVRVADYKTGESKVKASTMEDVFNGKDDAKHLLQLFLYAGMLADSLPRDMPGLEDGVRMEILSPDELPKTGAALPRIGSGKGVPRVESHLEVKEAFDAGMEALIKEIFDPETPFRAPQTEDPCKYCTLGTLCGRR